MSLLLLLRPSGTSSPVIPTYDFLLPLELTVDPAMARSLSIAAATGNLTVDAVTGHLTLDGTEGDMTIDDVSTSLTFIDYTP